MKMVYWKSCFRNLEMKVFQNDWALQKHSSGEGPRPTATELPGTDSSEERPWLSKVITNCNIVTLAPYMEIFKTKGSLGHFKVTISLSTWLPVNVEEGEDIITVLQCFCVS